MSSAHSQAESFEETRSEYRSTECTLTERPRAKSPPPDAKVIGFISGGSDICGTSYSAAKRNAKEAKTENGDKPIRTSSLTEEKVICFDEEDINNIQDPHHDGLVITLYVANHFIRRILIDGGSSVNIIQHEVLKKMGIPDFEIISKSSVLVGFCGEVKNTIGEIELPIYIEGTLDTRHESSTLNISPTCQDANPLGVMEINSDQQEAKNCYTSSMKASVKTRQGYQLTMQARDVLETKEQDVKEVSLDAENSDVKILVGSNISEDIEKDILNFLRGRKAIFAWKHEDMTSISKDIITHKLGIDKSFRPIHQKRRKFAPERNVIIQEEVERLLKSGMIREVKFPRWLANVVVV
ncbi:hypothetical protein L1987_40030 [Smallanthus sonchifolius]|uniref:Uncharacterized protein n=1 Tax=Smallanthus sonchifolius TaxID=185202 RepID=A0ACB9GSB5_9ASTR|nr:hypothetical protein L1987_40030 [Smallanthus sonchifolius]